MSCSTATKFWLEDIKTLFSSNTLIPNPEMSLEEQLNSITRLILCIWVVLYLLKYKNNDLFLLLSLLFIIILYYIQRNTMYKENYCNTPNPRQNCANSNLPVNDWTLLPKGNNLRIENPSKFRFCNDDVQQSFNQSQYSTNQALAGPPNPKTLAPVPVIPPPAAWDYWSQDYIIPSQINDQTNTDLIQSGYLSTSTCGETTHLKVVPDSPPQPCLDKRNPPPGYTRIDKLRQPTQPIVEGYNRLYPNPSVQQDPNCQHYWINDKGTPGDLIGCGYDPKQMLDHNIPSNVPSGQCSKNNVYNDYNKNLFTTIIQPGMYNKTEVVEPIQSNMGISFTQQFEPVTCHPSEDGKGTTYVTHDPRVIPPIIQPTPEPVVPVNSNIYDPRSNGYGTSYRSYIDTMTGQPRFFYDDIDAVRRPNYLTRSNIDAFKWAHTYDTINNDKTYGPVPNDLSHALAQNQFLESSLQQRDELQTRLMHKYNTSVAWQKRQAPMHTMGGKQNSCRM